MKTPINYYGGKTLMLPHLRPLVPPHTIYTETYLGGASMFFDKVAAKIEVINDINNVVVNFYEVLKTNYKSLKRLIDATLVSRYQHKKALSFIRNPKIASKVELAWAFWFVANMSFANKIGGGLKTSTDPETSITRILQNKKERFTELLEKRIESVNIFCDHAPQVLKKYDRKKSFHFIDPPYLNSDQGHYKGFTENDFVDLLETCNELKGKFMLTNYKSQVLDDFLQSTNWNYKEIEFNTMVNTNHKKRQGKVEVIITNYNIHEELGQLNLLKQIENETN